MRNDSPAPALAKLTPQETNARMEACLERISGRRPVFARRMMFPSDGAAYSITEAASWKCSTESQRNEALTAVEFALRPADENAIGAALYTLRIMTRGRAQMSDADREAEAMIWLEHLGRFPADIVLTTLKNWPTRPNGEWWPVWHDVQKDLEAQTSARRLLAEHIRSQKCLPAPAEEAERDDSPEGVAKRRAIVDARLAEIRKRQEEARPQPKIREPEEIGRQVMSEGIKLSEEARRLFRQQSESAVPDPAEQFDQWETTREGRAA